MLTIRLTRKGKKNQPFFRVVVIDKRRTAKGGRAVEELGYVDPLTKRHSFKKDRILHWIKMGAQPTARIHNMLVAEKIIEGAKIKTFSVTKKAKVEAEKAAATPATPSPSPQASAEQGAGAATEVPAEAPAEVTAPETPKEEEKPAEPEKTA